MYAELSCKTNFTFLEGASSPEELVKRAEVIGLKALAITDKDGVYALPKAYWASKDLPQLKLIVGAELTIQNHLPITLIAPHRQAYGVLCRIISCSHAGKEKGEAFLTLSELATFQSFEGFSDLFCLGEAGCDFSFLKQLFPNRTYVTLSRWLDGMDGERLEKALDARKKHNISWVATNRVSYHEKERRPLQDCFTSIKEGLPLNKAGFKLRPNAERYLKSDFEMRRLFEDVPDAVTNTMVIADACTFCMSELKYRYPDEWIPKGLTSQTYLEQEVWKGAAQRYQNQIPEKIRKQIVHELQLILRMKYADYFLTIYKIVTYAKSKDILCQGRGSAANSVVCYCLGITAVDPTKIDLLFERFISAERGEPPDIDVDFEHNRREEVIQYIYEIYGRERAAMLTAVVTYQKRMAFRELSKAFGIQVGALSSKKLLRDFENKAKESFDPHCQVKIEQLSEQMEGFPRHLSIHSGGFTLSADPLIEIVPIEPARMEGRTVIQWDKYDLDYLGLLKVDFLALGMLTALKKTLDLVGLTLPDLPHDDKATYDMIQKGDTIGTFQVESRAQINMAGRLLPRSFYDLVVQVAIVRPGPNVGKMVHPYLKRRRGLERPVYPHPTLRKILEKTLGVPLFQEQIMRIAIELGQFTPGEADQLRRAIGAWRSTGSLTQVAEKLIRNLRAEGVPQEYSNQILEHMKGFAHYGFPESHAASFALLAYASCYLKRHHHAEFTCGLLNSQPMGFYAPHSLVDDAKAHGVKVHPVSPNKSEWESTVPQKNHIRLGLHTVYGLSQKDAFKIILHRPYESMQAFLKVNTLRPDVLMRLSLGDAFKEFGDDQRHTLWRILDEKVKRGPQLDLFAGIGLGHNQALFEKLNEVQSIQSDYEAYGLSTRGHPMAALRKKLRLPMMKTAEVKRTKPRSRVSTSGLLLVRQKPPTAGGICFGALEDETGFIDIVLFKDVYARVREVFLHNCFFTVTGMIERDGHSVSLIVHDLKAIFNTPEDLVIEPHQYFF